MKKLERVNEVTAIDQFLALMDFLNAMGYNTEGLTVLEAAQIKYDIVKVIERPEDEIYGCIDWETRIIEEGDLPR